MIDSRPFRNPRTGPLSDSLDFTGERFVPELVREIWYEHWHRYVFALPWAAGRRVLDCACGEGYGADLLARRARSVTGLDRSAEAIGHARRRYAGGRDNLTFTEGDCAALPFADASFDLVVSFETLEHIDAQAAMLDEFHRVLDPGGLLVLSSPDRKTYSDDRGFENEFHVRELYRDELIELVGARFPAWRLYGQKLMFHSVIWPLDGEPGAGEVAVLDGDRGLVEGAVPGAEPLYYVMLCGRDEAALPGGERGLSLFADRAESVYEHYNAEVRHHMESGRVFEQMKHRIRELEAALPEAGRESAPRRWFQRFFGGRR